MCLRTDRNRLPRGHRRKQPTAHGSWEITRCCRLASPKNTYGYMKVPRVHRVLSILHSKLLEDSETTTRPYKESSDMELGTKTVPSLRGTQNENQGECRLDATQF